MRTTEEPAGAQKKRRPYRCFLLRCRLQEGAGPGGEPSWRFTVQEDGPDSPRRSFVCLEDLEAYLESEFGPSGKHATCPAECGARGRTEKRIRSKSGAGF